MAGEALHPRLTEKHKMELYGEEKKIKKKSQSWLERDERVIRK